MARRLAILVDSTAGDYQDRLVNREIAATLRSLRLQPLVVLPSKDRKAEGHCPPAAQVTIIPHGPAQTSRTWRRFLPKFVVSRLACGRFRKLFRSHRPQLVFVNGDHGWPAVRAAGALRVPCAWYLRALSPFYRVRASEIFPESLWGDLALGNKDRFGTHFVASSFTVVLDRLNRDEFPQIPILREPVHPRFFRHVSVDRTQARGRCGLADSGHVVGVVVGRSRREWDFAVKFSRYLRRFIPSFSLLFRELFPAKLPPAPLKKLERSFGPASLHFFPADGDVADFYRACDVVAVLEEASPGGVAALEATAVGTPVVVRKLAGLREVIRHGVNGIAVPGQRFRVFARYVAIVLTRRQLRERLAQVGRLYALKRFGIHAFRQNLRRMLQRFLAEPSHSV